MATKEQDELIAYLIALGVSAHAAIDFVTRGRLTKIETGVLMKIFKRTIPKAVGFAARGHPLGVAASLVAAGIIHREQIGEVAQSIASDPRVQAVYEEVLEYGSGVQSRAAPYVEPLREPIGAGAEARQRLRPIVEGFFGNPHSISPPKRRKSRANTAVSQAMKWLKGGTRKATGAAPGKLAKNAFKMATKAAGMANPKTPSKPGKGKSIINKLARRLKKWW